MIPEIRSLPIRRWLGFLIPFLATPVALVSEAMPPAVVWCTFALLIGSMLQPEPGGRPFAKLSLCHLLAGFAIVSVPLSIFASPLFLDVSWPRLFRLVWGLAVCCAVSRSTTVDVASSRADERLVWLTHAYLTVGVLVAAVGLFATEVLYKIPGIGAAHRAWVDSLGSSPLANTVSADDLAGTLVLFTPLAFSLACAAWTPERSSGPTSASRRTSAFPSWERILLPIALIVFLSVILVTQSRSGLFSLAIALAICVLLMGTHGLRIAAIVAVVMAVGFTWIGIRNVTDFVAYGGRLQRSVLTGRPEIWGASLQAIGDVPFTGVGLGMFSRAVPDLYPTANGRSIEDAHNLYLQVACDFGVPGLIVFVAVYVAAFLTALKLYLTSRDTRRRYWVTGVLCGLVAHLIFGLVDVVPPGTVLGVFPWFLLGLLVAAYRAEHDDAPRLESGHPASRSRFWWGVVAIGIAAGVGWRSFTERLVLNLAARNAIRALIAEPEELEAAYARLGPVAAESCRANWLRGVLASRLGWDDERNEAWASCLACAPEFIHRVRAKAPRNVTLASISVFERGSTAESYFWLADVRTDEDPDEAIGLYRAGLRLDPGDGESWLELGDLLASRAPEEALEAYRRACNNGDPGANGCYRAGRTAENLGRPDAAVHFYRLSRWERAHARADELEKRQ